MNPYISRMRAHLGSTSFMHPGARILIENERGEFLTIERKDNGSLGIPAGALEEGETILECIIREVREETGLTVLNPVVIGISSDPSLESVEYPNGDQIQYFTVEFYANVWEGTLQIHDAEEINKLGFLPREKLQALPDNERSTLESLEYYREKGQVYVR